MKLQTAKCTVCGASLKLSVDKTISECSYCKSQIIVSNALDFNKVEVDKSKDIVKYRDNLKKYIRNNSIEEILRVSNQILDILPKDFLASYFAGYAHQVKGEHNYIYEFYSNILEHTPDELETVVEHINKRSDLRDKQRITSFLEKIDQSKTQSYLDAYESRQSEEDNFADIPRDVFVCHSSKNLDIAKKVVERLENDGNTCWVSYRNLRPNDTDNYWENIKKAIDKSAIFLVISDLEAMRSKDVQAELSYAQEKVNRKVEFKIDDKPHTQLFKHVFDGIKWIEGVSLKKGLEALTQRIFEEKEVIKDLISKKQWKGYVQPSYQVMSPKTKKLGLIIGAGVIALTLLVGFSITNLTTIDNTPPIIQLSGSASMSLNQGDIYNEPGAIVSDDVDTALDPLITGNVNTNVPGTYTIRYNATDNAGNRAVEKTRTVTVRASNLDTIKPVIRLNGDSTITLEVKSNFIDPSASVSDNKDINVNLITSGVVNSGVVGTYTLRYNAIDNAGNRAEEVVRTVRVVDTTRPVVTLNGSSTVRIRVGEIYTDPGITVSDNYDDTSRIQQNVTGGVNWSAPGTYTVSFTATDSSGNISLPVNRTIIVENVTIDTTNLNNATTFVTVEINPSIGLALNNNDVVTQAFSINFDGSKVLTNLDLVGVNFNTALTSLIQSANTKGFISSTDAILIGIESNNESKLNSLEIAARGILTTQSSNLGKTITTQIEKSDLDVAKATSVVSGLTPSNAKVKLINDVSASTNTSYNSNATLNIKQLIDKKTFNFTNTNVYSISYTLNSGTQGVGAPTSFNVAQLPLTLPTPTRSGFNFQGWFESSNFVGNPVTQIPSGTNQDKRYFAKWSANQIFGDRIIDVSINVFSSIAVSSDRRVFTWGSNSFGQLGNNYSTSDSSLPIDVTSRFGLLASDRIIITSIGRFYNSALSSNGRVFTWGNNEFGQLGDNSVTNKYSPTDITSRFGLLSGDKIIDISSGRDHSSALSSTGRVFTWGYNKYGQLGDNTTTNKSVPTAEITSRFGLSAGDKIVSISLGGDHSSAISSNGRVFTWGGNSSGQLGDNTITNKSVPTEITSRFGLSTGDKIVSISLGEDHSSAISSNGRVFTWGNNLSGQLGDNTITNKSVPTDITSRFTLDSRDKIVSISLSMFNSAAISSNGRVFTWGGNTWGQLGQNTTIFRQVPTDITSRFTLDANDKIVLVSLGNYNSAAISSNGRVFTWGSNNMGQLGDGTKIDKLVPTLIRVIE